MGQKARKKVAGRSRSAGPSRQGKSGVWQLQSARAHLSDVVAAASRAPQRITRNGKPVAVVLSPAEYDRLAKPKGSLLEFFQNSPLATAMAEGEVSFERDRDPIRDVDL
jgi:antitoxin Phd